MKFQTLLLPFVLVAAGLAVGCMDDIGQSGRVRISVSDSPIDELPISGVNLIFTSVEAKKDGVWYTFRTFDTPVGVNLLALTGGKSFLLIDQVVEPGVYTEFRFSIMTADPSSSVLRSPLSTIEFRNGTSKPLFLANQSAAFVVAASIHVSERGVAEFNFDIDVRKSLVENTGTFTFNPVVRVVNVPNSGTLSGRVLNAETSERLLVFAYAAGTFSAGEVQRQNGVRFGRAVASAPVESRRFQIGFLEEAAYDLVFVRLDEKGAVAGIRGVARNIEIAARQTATPNVDLKLLSQN